MPTVMYWMSSSQAQHFADIAGALTLVVFSFVLWPLLSKIDGLKISRQAKTRCKIAIAAACFVLTFLVFYPQYLQLFA